MKNTLSIIALLLLASISRAQITLEHTYYPSQTAQAVLLDAGTKIMVLDTGSNIVTLYNTDYTTVWKSITVPTIANYKLANIILMSDKLFNLDANVEYQAVYGKLTPGPERVVTYNEAGTVLLLQDSLAIPNTVSNFDGNYKLVSRFNGYITRFYSLPGSLPCNSCGTVSGLQKQPSGIVSAAVPNPSSGMVNISYFLPAGSTGTITLTNVNGQTVQTVPVSSSQTSIQLNTSLLVPGNYIYTISAEGVLPASNVLTVTR